MHLRRKDKLVATLGELKARIIAETNRDDLRAGEELEATLALSIARAIEHFSDEHFWFNRERAIAATSAGANFVNLPYAIRIPLQVACEGELLRKVPADLIGNGTCTGRPGRWAERGDRILLSPTPDSAYDLLVSGVAQIDAPDGDSDENVWTNEAQDLVAARTRFLLFRDVFRDVEGTQLAAQAEGEALSRLQRETRRRGVSRLGSAGDEPWSG